MLWYMGKIEFSEWLSSEMERRGMNSATVAAFGNTNTATIWRIAKGERSPGIDSILAIAQGLKVSPVEVFCKATDQPLFKEDAEFQKIIYLYNRLDEKDKQTILDMMAFLLNK